MYYIARSDYSCIYRILVNNGVGLHFSDLIASEPNKYYHKDIHNLLLSDTIYRKVFRLKFNALSVILL